MTLLFPPVFSDSPAKIFIGRDPFPPGRLSCASIVADLSSPVSSQHFGFVASYRVDSLRTAAANVASLVFVLPLL